MSTEVKGRRVSKPLAGIALVAAVSAGLGAFFGIRAAQGAGSAPSAGQPPARTGGAMAYDAANHTVILFGGQSKSRSLGDTWIWNGALWSQARPATSPPALVNAQMAYDPVTQDVILVGGEQLGGWSTGPIACSAGGGSSSSGTSSSGSSGSATLIPPRKPIPAIAPAPSATVGTITTSPPGCGVINSPKPATWLCNRGDRAKSLASTPFSGFGSGTLATDPVSGRVLLINVGPFAEPALGAALPDIACPVQAGAMPDSQVKCPYPFPVPAPGWSWTGHAWKALASTGTGLPFGVIGSSIITDAVTGRLAVFGGEFIAPVPAPLPPQCPNCVAGITVPQSDCCHETVRVWDGRTWKQAATFTGGPALPGDTFVGDAATHSDVLLTGDGQTWVWSGVWKQVHPGATPPRRYGAAAAYDAATGQVVLFGGFASSSHASGLYDQTWTWDDSTWTMRGGSSGPSVPIPVPTPGSVPPEPPCEPIAEPAGTTGTVPAPHTICNGTGGSASGNPGSGPVNASGSGVVAP
jgi:hypothetical protein